MLRFRLRWPSDCIWLLRLFCSLLRFHTCKCTESEVHLFCSTQAKIIDFYASFMHQLFMSRCFCLCCYLLELLLTQFFEFFAVFLLQLQIILLLYGVGIDLRDKQATGQRIRASHHCNQVVEMLLKTNHS